MEKIYVFAVLTRRHSYVRDAEECGDTLGYATNSKGEIIESHYSSGVNWTKHDMGITSDWKHDKYKERYPDGYELIWLGAFETFEDAIQDIVKE